MFLIRHNVRSLVREHAVERRVPWEFVYTVENQQASSEAGTRNAKPRVMQKSKRPASSAMRENDKSAP